MASDWIKSRDREFLAQAENLNKIIASHMDTWGLCEADLDPLVQLAARFEAALVEQSEKSASYHATVLQKQATREELERALRMLVRRVNNHPGMTEDLRREMEIASPTRQSTRCQPTSQKPVNAPNADGGSDATAKTK